MQKLPRTTRGHTPASLVGSRPQTAETVHPAHSPARRPGAPKHPDEQLAVLREPPLLFLEALWYPPARVADRISLRVTPLLRVGDGRQVREEGGARAPPGGTGSSGQEAKKHADALYEGRYRIVSSVRNRAKPTNRRPSRAALRRAHPLLNGHEWVLLVSSSRSQSISSASSPRDRLCRLSRQIVHTL